MGGGGRKHHQLCNIGEDLLVPNANKVLLAHVTSSRVGKRSRPPSAKLRETIKGGFEESLQDQNSKQ